MPVVELPEADLAVPLAEALVAGGLSCVEITFRTPAAREGLAAIREAHPEILLGAGTVLDVGAGRGGGRGGRRLRRRARDEPGDRAARASERGLPMLPGHVHAERRRGARGGSACGC